MRSYDVSLQMASREESISPRTVIRWGGSALTKRQNGQYAAKATDRLLRVLKVPTLEGPREIVVRGSREASRLGEYWAAVHRYYETGDASGLQKFRGGYVENASRVRIPLLTDLDHLNRLGSAGVLSFESLYARRA
jgi:hypothetical protein